MFTQKNLSLRINSRNIFLVTCVLIAPAQSAWSQVPGQINRKIEAISALPAPGTDDDLYQIVGYLSVDANEIIDKVDLSTVVAVHINGIVVDEIPLRLSAEPVAGSPCGPCDFFEVCTCGTNPNSGVFGCQCGSFFTFGGTTNPLRPGDEIMVLLRPAPGAIPDSPDQQGDDLMIITYHGRPIFWDRKVVSVDFLPTAQTEGNSTAEVTVAARANYDGKLDLGFELEVLIDNVPQMNIPVEDLDITWIQCLGDCDNTDCALLNGITPKGICSNALPLGWTECACTSTNYYKVFIPDIPGPGGPNVKIILKPAPGALPELPGCLEKPEGDLDGDCDVELDDLMILLANWLKCNHLNQQLCF